MSIPAETLADPPAQPEPAGDARVAAARPGQARWLALSDPEWPLCLIVLLAPAGLALALGQTQKASFFLGAAVYLAVLQWLGWAVFGRLTAVRPRFLLFPAELFAGLAVICTWFYLRNLVAKAWPASYALRELAWLFPVVLVLQAAALVLRGPALVAVWRASPRAALVALGERLALYAAFAAVLTAALWSISGALGVQGTDAITYTLQARVCRDEGIGFAVPPTNTVIPYPSGFAAMNATASALAPLSVLQAFHLQHVLLCVAGIFLITTTLAALLGRALPLLHSLPAAFLFVFPVYALYPDVFYPGTPKQAGPPLCAAVCLLPLLAPVARRGLFLIAAAVVAMLAVLAAAVNPACALFAVVAGAVAWLVFTARGRPGLGLASLAGLGLAWGALVVGCDAYYGQLIRPAPSHEPGPPAEAAAEMPTAPALAQRFSWPQGARAAAEVNPFTLSPVVTMTVLLWDRAEHLKGWDARWPARAVPPAVLLLALVTLGGLLPRRSRATTARDPLVRLLVCCVLLWLVLKYLVNFCAGGMMQPSYEEKLLAIYLRYLLLRCELLLLFACLAAAGVRLYLALERQKAGRGWKAAAATGMVAACWLLPALGLLAGVEVSGFPTVPAHDRFAVTADDLRLAAWLGDNVPPDRGDVGLAAMTFSAGHEEERHIYPVGGGHALVLYGRYYNFRFLSPVLEGRSDIEAYEHHVRDDFDAEWCRRNGIRYFYATPDGLARNPGLANAVGAGTLQLRHQEGESRLYEVVAP
jgi:hypothetical protein